MVISSTSFLIGIFMGWIFFSVKLKNFASIFPLNYEQMVIVFTWKKFYGSESSVALCNGNYFLFTYKKSPVNLKLIGIKIVNLMG